MKLLISFFLIIILTISCSLPQRTFLLECTVGGYGELTTNESKCIRNDLKRQVQELDLKRNYRICVVVKSSKKVSGKNMQIYACPSLTTDEVR